MTSADTVDPRSAVIAARRRLAKESLADFACMVDIPTAPITDAEDEDSFSVMRLDKGLADHHALLCGELQDLADGKTPNLMVLMPPGSAKALALDTPIPTPDGWKAMGDLVVGDRVFDETGTPCSVTWVSPVWRGRPVYSVRTDCGDTIVADRDHEWLVRLCGKRDVFKIKETRELARVRSKRPMIRRAGAMALPSADLPIDPYLLGVWLGDGSKQSVRISSSVEDQSWLRAELGRLGYETRSTTVETLFQVIGVRGAFNRLGLLTDPLHNTFGRKHIPAVYLRGSVAQRLSLLQGLIDTDGTVCKRRGCTTFCNTNRELAEGVRELARSLGVKAGWSEGRAMLNGKDCGPLYRVSFYLAGSARMPRKAALARDQYRTPDTYIDAAPAGRADTVCIEVDSASHLFLCGRSMTPTHNSTYVDVVFIPWFMARFPRRNVILASYAANIARKQGRRARQLVNSTAFGSLFPGVGLSGHAKAADEWSLTTGGEYMAGGLLGGLTGNRGALGVLDDPVAGREEAESETMRQKTWDAYIDDFCSRLIPGSPQVLILTRWHQDDVAGRILPETWNGESGWFDGRDGRRWKVLCLPALAEKPDDPLGRAKGESLWPEWFGSATGDPMDHWRPFQRNVRTWSSLYQQRPSPEEGTYFQRSWFRRFTEETLPRSLRYFGTSDYAVTEGGGDNTVLRVWAVDSAQPPNIYLVDGWRGQTTSDVWIETQIDLIERYRHKGGIQRWVGEAGVIQKAIEPMLVRRLRERRVSCRLEWLPSAVDKPSRARGAQALAREGRVFVRDDMDGDCFLDEAAAFPAGKYDDDVDNLSLMGRIIDTISGPARKDRPTHAEDFSPF